MTLLVAIDASASSLDAARYAVRSYPEEELVLVHVSPSGRVGDLAQGRFLLESARRDCLALAPGVRITTRLEIGERGKQLQKTAEESGCRLVLLGAQGMTPCTHRERVSPETVELAAAVTYPVVLILPTGEAVSGIAAAGDDPCTRRLRVPEGAVRSVPSAAG